MKSTRRPPVGRGGEEWGRGEAGALVFSQQEEDFWRSSEDFFVFICKSPLWPEGISARLIPGIPGMAGKEGGSGQRFVKKKDGGKEKR